MEKAVEDQAYCSKECINIIIPVYNVEPYIKKCLDSILNQTYRNLKIILVDDGSTDCSGQICENYACMDKRIICIHKANGGVSSARNAGLEITNRGGYISFVDPDDWADCKMFEILHNDIVNSGAELVICGYYMLNSEEHMETCTYNQLHTIDSEYALKLLAQRKIESHLWNKLFKRELFENIRFDEGKIYEDILVMKDLFTKCKRICFEKQNLYYYRWRENSLIHCNSFQSIYDNLNSRLISAEFFKKDYFAEAKSLYAHACEVYLWLCWSYVTEGNKKEHLRQIKESAVRLNQMNRDLGSSLPNYHKGKNFKEKTKLFIARIFPGLYVNLEQLLYCLKKLRKSPGIR